MRNLSGRPLTLGSVSPLQMLRGMLDISLGHWRESPLLAGIRGLLLAVAILGIVDLPRSPDEGLVLAGIGLLGFYSLRK